jgi:hypothetical protein
MKNDLDARGRNRRKTGMRLMIAVFFAGVAFGALAAEIICPKTGGRSVLREPLPSPSLREGRGAAWTETGAAEDRMSGPEAACFHAMPAWPYEDGVYRPAKTDKGERDDTEL